MWKTTLYILLLPILSVGQNINFEINDLHTAQKKAKKEQKGIFIDIHTNWCKNCEWMQEEVFKTKKVSSYYNNHYINLSVDAESKLGKTLVEKYNLSIYPSYLYLNQDAEALHLVTGLKSKEEFIEASKEAEDPNNQLFVLQKLVKNEKEPDIKILSNYIYTTYNAAYEDEIMLSKFLGRLNDDLLKEESIWRALKEATMHNGLHSESLHYIVKHSNVIESEHGIKDIIQTINAAASISMQPYVEEKNIKGWEKLMSYLNTSLGKQGTTLNLAYNPTFYINIQDFETAYNKMSEGVKTLHDRDPEVRAYLYRNWAWDVYHYYNDQEKLGTALEWVDNSLDVHYNSINLETKSGILLKLKSYEKAKMTALEAIELAKKEKVHPTLAYSVLEKLNTTK
ncbi:thioredoxin family protein [Flammeovirga sp. MY04]|uniref:thioredoxin family protein n=1 Tax=Flammeovirga sp. MY04 TaxID=1191459 RepID=UPI000806122D|nr:thioredoxin family protein [Flammeovirga sp. MY04]ANQ48277.1 thioredoxin family protein [Flammeovirga sp. MY04]